jgi:proline dehydrogenase
MLRTALLRIADSHRLARWLTTNKTASGQAQRFVAGESLGNAIAAARRLNEQGRMVSLDHLGESVRTEGEARAAAETALGMFDRIASEKLDANVSIKLTQMGLDLDESLCEELAWKIVERAQKYRNFVRIDMEGSAYTQRTVDIAKRLRTRSPAVGAVLQSYLYRTEQDARDLVAVGCRIRLCKGAYKEPEDVAFPRKADVDENFCRVTKLLLQSGIYHGIATHDPAMIAATKSFAAHNNIGRDHFEFQMLYGIRTDLQERLVRDGYRLRVYVPFGKEWFPYFMRRLAERPANLVFLLRHMVRQ